MCFRREYMDLRGFVKRSGVVFAAVSAVFFFVPYLAPLILLGDILDRDCEFF